MVAICLIAGIGALTWTKSVSYLEAGFKARDGLENIRETDFQTALLVWAALFGPARIF